MIATETLLQEPAIQALGWALLHFVWQGTLVGVLAGLALRALRTSAPDVRYVVSAIALALMATMPLVTGVQAWRAARADAAATAFVASPEPGSAATLLRATEPGSPVHRAARECSTDVRCGASVSAAGPERWFPLVVFVWMTGVALLALRLVGGWIYIHRLKTRGAVAADATLRAVVGRLTRTLHISRPVQLLQAPGVDVPTVVGWLKPVILLPVSTLAGLSPLQVEAILAHELAHIRRHDFLVNLLQSLLETLLFYHPAVWWLSRRIRIEREHCCDDLAVALCGDPIVYARALADLEELRGVSTQLAMAANGGALVERIRRLLAAPSTHADRGPAWLAAAAALVLMLGLAGGAVGRHSVAAAGDIAAVVDVLQQDDETEQVPPVPPPPPAPPVPVAAAPAAGVADLPVQPAPQAPPAPPAPPSPPSIEFDGTIQKSSGNFSWSHNGEKLSIEYRGAFTLNDTDSDVASMTPGSYLRIRDGGWFKGRSVEFHADASGNITRRFRVVNDERPFEPEGREWLAKVLPRFIRHSGFGAKGRVERFLEKGGVAAVLAEISLIETSHGKKVYFTELMKQASLDGAAARRLLEQAGREIDSDYELASTLIAGADRVLVDEATRKAYFDAARAIDSDYEMRRVFTAALKRGQVSAPLLAGILDASRSIGSDYEAASLLLDVLKNHAIEGELRGPFFSALQTVGSSYEKGRVLQRLLGQQNLSAETLASALTHAAEIGGDYETAQVLIAAARAHAITGSARDTYVRVAERLGEYERNRSLAALARTQR